MNEELPLLEPAFSGWDYGSLPAVQRDGYTANQMREYAKAVLAQPEREPRNVRERWNIELDGNDLLVCFNDHEKGDKCRYERYSPLPEQELECPNLKDCKGDCFQCEYFNVKTLRMEYPETQTEQTSAEKTLHKLGYTNHGGELWVPPLNSVPAWAQPNPQPEQRLPLTDEQAHQMLLSMAAHIETFGDDSLTEQQLSAECLRFILERVADHNI